MINDSGQNTAQLIEQTLSEQLQISDREIDDRKQLLDFGPEDAAALVALRGFIQTNLNDIVDAFYSKQRMNTEFALLIGDSETFRRLHASMHHYVLELFEGYYDAEYVNKRLRIGKVHKRIGVSPKLYLSAIAQLEAILQHYIGLALDEQAASCDPCRNTAGALHKLLMFDVQFVFDTYIHSLVSEVETTRQKVEEYAHSLEETVALRTRELEQLSRLDPLTELDNQRSFYEHLRRELARAERQSQPLSLLLMDLNHFKLLNDTEGHKRGDEVLQLVGACMRATSRASDICCRYGGDEFCILLPDTDYANAIAYGERLLQQFDLANDSAVSISIGIAQAGTKRYVHGDTLVRQADQSMYRAKALAHKNGDHQIDRTGSVLHPVQQPSAYSEEDTPAQTAEGVS